MEGREKKTADETLIPTLSPAYRPAGIEGEGK
jgi:hypothetical protein